MPNQKLEAALAYAKRGWSVIPCYPGDKKPRGDWKQYQTTKRTEAALKEHWQQYPDDNVGVVTGRVSNLTVVDVDGGAGEESLQSLPQQLPITRTHATPHGRHLLFSHQPELYTGAGFLPNIDVRSDGGFIVMPPSVLADGGSYAVDHMQDPASMGVPASVLYERRKETTIDGETIAGSNRPDWVTEALTEGAGAGLRNATTAKLAGYFHNIGVPTDIIMGILYSFGEKCNPPMDRSEINTVVSSTERYHTTEQPELRPTIRGLNYLWPESGIQILVENLRLTTDGCKCRITVLDRKGDHLLAPSAVDMLSVGSRSALIRALQDRTPHDWSNVIETLSSKILNTISEETPVVTLDQYIDAEVPKWLLEPFILGDGATILFGQGGLGKSMLVLAAMLTLDTGLPILGHTKRTEGSRGLYLDWEDSAETQAERYAMMLRGIGKDPSKYKPYYQQCSAPLHDNISRLKEYIDGHKITYLVLDSAALACGGAPDSSDSALNFFNAIKRLGIPSLIIAHQTKNISHPYPFGSIFWHNSARCTWEIRGQSEAGDSIIPIQLINRKSNRGTKAPDAGYELDFGTDYITIKALNGKESRAYFGDEGKSLSHRIGWCIVDHGGKMAASSIAQALGENRDNVGRTLRRNKHFIQVGTVGKEILWGVEEKND